MRIEKFANEYRALMESVRNSNEEGICKIAKKKLIDLRFAGRFLAAPQDREQLSSWCRTIGDMIYEAIGEYPAVRIYPFETEEAIRVAKEIKDPKERCEILCSIMPYAPLDSKNIIISDALNAANMILDINDRAKAIRDLDEQNQCSQLIEEPRAIPIPRQIPPPPADFKGREKEISNILSNFDAGATITGIRGMGGIGKTALAFVLAEKLKDRFVDGQILIDMRGTSPSPLSNVDAMSQVIRAYLPTYHLPNELGELQGLYLSVLAGKRVLLLLDNVANREQIESLLPPSSCALLITSRNKFTLPGLKEQDLDVLPPDKAIQLLLEIAERIGDRANELAKLCGYLPVALRNAASAFAEREDLSVLEYEHLLSDKKKRLELVEATFSLSYDLLTSKRRNQWCRLSVFPKDFDRMGATAVLKMASDPSAEALSDLVKWSLVDFITIGDSDNRRYRLHDLARIFAESRLDSLDRNDAYRQLSKHYLKILAKANDLYEKSGDSTLVGLSLFDREWENIQSGHAWIELMAEDNSKLKTKTDRQFLLKMAGAYPFKGSRLLDLRLHPKERIRWLNTALMASQRLQQKNLENWLLTKCGYAYSDLGEIRKSIELFEQALKINRVIRDRMSEADSLGNLGLSHAVLGDVHKAIAYHKQALIISHEINDKRGEVVHLGDLGDAYYDISDARKASDYYKQALTMSREIGDKNKEAIYLNSLGDALVHLGETYKAIECHEQALAICRIIDNKRIEGKILGSLGSVNIILGDVDKAIEFYEQALAISCEIGDRRGEGSLRGLLGKAYNQLGETNTAIKFFEHALTIGLDRGYLRIQGENLGNLGDAYFYLGDTHKAVEFYDRALTINRQIGYKRGEGENLCHLGNVYLHIEDTIKANEYFEIALEINRQIGYKEGERSCLSNLGNAYYRQNDIRKTIEYDERALSISREIGDKHAEGITLGNMGVVYDELYEVRKAIEYYEKSLSINRETGDKRGEVITLGNIGLSLFYSGKTCEAIKYYRHALLISENIRYRKGETSQLCNLGMAYSAIGKISEAIDIHQRSLSICKEIDDKSGEGENLNCLGLAHLIIGESTKSIDYYKNALEISRKIRERKIESEALSGLGKAYAGMRNFQKAIEYYKQSLDIALMIEDKRIECEVYCWLGKAYLEINETQNAIENCEKSLNIAHEIEYNRGEGEALFCMGLTLHSIGQLDEATNNAKIALKIFENIESPLATDVRKKIDEWQS